MDELCCSYSVNCYSLEDILSTNERVPCQFNDTVHHLGFLDSSGGGGDDSGAIAAGSRLELPLWLAHFLCTELPYGRRLVSVSAPPAIYRAQQRHQLHADASVVQLSGRAPNFYLTGLHVLQLPLPEAAAIAQCLVETLRCRLRPIMDSCQQLQPLHSAASCHDQELLGRLEQLERTLLAAGRKSARSHHSWMGRQNEQLTTDHCVLSHRKRKSAALN